MPHLTYDIDDSGIASIDSDGTITGLHPGVARITASAGGISSNADITVKLDKLIILDPGHGGGSPGAIPKASDGSSLTQYREAVLNMQIVEKIRDRLQKIGADVILTREDDTNVPLEDRTKTANDMNADLFISIHHDSVSTPTATGTSAFYSSFKPGIDIDGIYAVADGDSEIRDADGTVLGNLEDGEEYNCVKFDDNYIYIDFNGEVGKTTTDYVIVRDKSPSAASLQSVKLARVVNGGIISLGLPPHGIRDNNYAVNKLTNCASVLVEVGFISNPNEFEIVRKNRFQSKIAEKIVQAIVELYKNENTSEQGNEGTTATP
jgi:N-acetylmuramoyl-L-alanine amidase